MSSSSSVVQLGKLTTKPVEVAKVSRILFTYLLSSFCNAKFFVREIIVNDVRNGEEIYNQ